MKSDTRDTMHINESPATFAKNSNDRGSRTGTKFLLCVVLAIVTLAVYWQVGNHQFLNFDDDVYVTDNQHIASGFTSNNIVWAFTSVDAANWHPITWLSHMADVQFYGMNPRGHHLTNVAIHTTSALLLFLLLFRMTNAAWQSFFVASLFALHPLHVESVAWVAERKDVLSALFCFLTLIFYAEFVAHRKPSQYAFSLFCFVLGLMSKPMLVTLPFVMLLLDLWPLGRLRDEQLMPSLRPRLSRTAILVVEKIPFFACSLLSGLITLFAQSKGGAIVSLAGVSFRLRSENALIAYIKYIGKALWPHDLAIFYPLPLAIPLWQVISSLSILFLLSAASVRTVRSHPYIAVGWFWFFITLLPVIGLLQVGSQSMADRYSYIPLIGLFIMAAWGVPWLTRGLRYQSIILSMLAGAIIIASAVSTWQQLGYWRDNISLYRHTIQITTDNYMIYNNLGNALAEREYLDYAILEYKNALRINPNYADAHVNLGLALGRQGNLDAAIREFRVAVREEPNNLKAHQCLKLALIRQRMSDVTSK